MSEVIEVIVKIATPEGITYEGRSDITEISQDDAFICWRVVKEARNRAVFAYFADRAKTEVPKLLAKGATLQQLYEMYGYDEETVRSCSGLDISCPIIT